EVFRLIEQLADALVGIRRVQVNETASVAEHQAGDGDEQQTPHNQPPQTGYGPPTAPDVREGTLPANGTDSREVIGCTIGRLEATLSVVTKLRRAGNVSPPVTTTSELFAHGVGDFRGRGPRPLA